MDTSQAERLVYTCKLLDNGLSVSALWNKAMTSLRTWDSGLGSSFFTSAV